jgi:peptidoglycan/LPS O-acetylase OafA/YrhL
MSIPNNHNDLKYRPDIDGLRAIAVLAVVLCHAELGLPGGYVGVDVFFVISGFLITSLILKDLHSGCFSMLDFWERRVRRILPALAAVLIATLATAWFLLLPDDYVALAKSLVAITALSANIYFWNDIGYFSQVAEEKPLLHTWSLAVEEQFYLFLPVGIALLWRILRGKNIFPVILVGALLSLILSAIIPPSRSDANFYLLPTRAWELFAGSLLAMRPQLGLKPRPKTKQALGIIGLFLILWPCLAYTKETRFPGLSALPPVVGAIFVIMSGTGGVSGICSRFLTLRPFVFIGLISYSLYLWHWPILAFSRYVSSIPLSTELRILLALASIPLAILSWKYIETPFRKRTIFPSRNGILISGIAALLVLASSGAAIWINHGFEQRLPKIAQKFERTGGEETRFRFDYDPNKIPDSFYKLGAKGAVPNLLVWGDSFSWALLPAIEEVLSERGLAGYGASYAAMAPVLDYTILTTHVMNDAPEKNSKIIDYLRNSDIANVWLVASWQSHEKKGGDEFEKKLKETCRQLLEMGKNVCFVIDPPSYSYNVRRILVRKAIRGESLQSVGMRVDEYDKKKIEVLRIAKDLERMGASVIHPKSSLLDPRDMHRIAVSDQHGSYYSDGYHLSRYGSMQLKPAIHAWFDSSLKAD